MLVATNVLSRQACFVAINMCLSRQTRATKTIMILVAAPASDTQGREKESSRKALHRAPHCSHDENSRIFVERAELFIVMLNVRAIRYFIITMVSTILVQFSHFVSYHTDYRFQMWRDEYLRWDPGDFANITGIYIPQTLIWLPDIVMQNE